MTQPQHFESNPKLPDRAEKAWRLSWSENLLTLGQTKAADEREATHDGWQVGELSRQLDSELFERARMAPPKLSTALRELHPGVSSLLEDRYFFEFLELLSVDLESLDRDVEKAHEGPSIGRLPSATKGEAVVEYALSRSLSPALIAEYQTTMPPKPLLLAKLHECYAQLAQPEVSPRGNPHRTRKDP